MFRKLLLGLVLGLSLVGTAIGPAMAQPVCSAYDPWFGSCVDWWPDTAPCNSNRNPSPTQTYAFTATGAGGNCLNITGIYEGNMNAMGLNGLIKSVKTGTSAPTLRLFSEPNYTGTLGIIGTGVYAPDVTVNNNSSFYHY